jgi:hypothetical protein
VTAAKKQSPTLSDAAVAAIWAALEAEAELRKRKGAKT